MPDERLEVTDRNTFLRLLSDGGKVGWKLQLHPRVGWTAFLRLRLFRNDPRIRFEGVIHEHIHAGVEAAAHADGLEVGVCDLKLHHVGYEGDQRGKNPRNIPLLRYQLSREPNHVYCWWHLGECLRLSGNEEGAAEAWSIGIARLRESETERLKLSNGALYLSLIKLRHDRGAAIDDLIAQALSLFPNRLGLQCLAARLAVVRDELETARPVLEKLTAIDADTFFDPDLAYDKALFGHLSAEPLALCYFRSGRYDDAARLYRVAVPTSPDPATCELKAQRSRARK